MRVIIYDTTLRDGTQREGLTLLAEDKLKLAKKLDGFGVDYIEGGWPGSNPKDKEFFALAKGWQPKHSVLTAFGSTRKKDILPENDLNLQSILESGVKAAAIFGKTWIFHVIEALNTTKEENLKMIYDSVAYLTSKGLEVHFDAEHFFDGYKDNPEYALACLEQAYLAGAKSLVLCDTNGGTLPDFVYKATKVVVEKFPNTLVGIHAHNDSELAVANSLLAIDAGAKIIQGTINGYGERCGNANLCSIIPNLKLKKGYDLLLDDSLKRLTEVSHYFDEIANLIPDDYQPFTGKAAFAHKGGIHVSALRKNPETYEHIQPELVGNKRRVLVSELSGIANLSYKAEEYGVFEEQNSFSPLLNTVKNLEFKGYSFEGAEASFELLLKRSLGLIPEFFELKGLRMIIEKNGSETVSAEATIKILVGDRLLHTVSDGDGPVNALDKALKLALRGVYPEVDDIQLTDYKVRVLDPRSATAASVRVLIESTGFGASWGTVGVSPNIIEASWRALSDSINYGLYKARDISNQPLL